MSLDINRGLPPAVHSAGQHSSSFIRCTKFLFVLAVFVMLGALALRRYYYSGQPNTAFAVKGKVYHSNAEYMSDLYANDLVFRHIGSHSQAQRREYTHFAKSTSTSGLNPWIMFGRARAQVIHSEKLNPSSIGGIELDLVNDTWYEGGKLTAQEVYAFIDARNSGN